MDSIDKIYSILLKKHGLQGWWPLLELHDRGGVNPTKSGSVKGYHPGDYSYPKNSLQKFEICLGAILTQNTSWPNVEKALLNLKKQGLISPEKFNESNIEIIKEALRPAGYFNQKSRKIIEFSLFYSSLEGRTPLREELLSLWGIGNETADSILLYAYNVPSFVVDAYTRRIFLKLGIITEKSTYEEVKSIFENNLPKDYKVYQEFHALIVEEGKNTK